MTKKEFRFELLIVVRYLLRNPCNVGITRIHLTQYVDKRARALLPDNWIKGCPREPFTKFLVDDPVAGPSIERRRASTQQFVKDCCYCFDLLIDMYFLFYGILVNRGVSAEQCKRIMRTWISKVSRWRMSPIELGRACKFFVETILTKIADTPDQLPHYTSWKSFMTSLKEVSPNLSFFYQPIKPIFEAWMRYGNIQDFRDLYQIGEYVLRGNMRSLDFSEEQLQTYLKFEEWLHTSEIDADLLTQFKLVSDAVFGEGDYDTFISNLIPAHGSGAIANDTRRSRWMKYHLLKAYRSIMKEMPELYDFISVVSPHVEDMVPSAVYSEVVDVPKNLLKNRTISKENVSLQFCQHAIFNGMNAVFHNNDILRNIICLEDSSRNGVLAAIGSIDGSYATIDLSSASDSVRCLHVRQLPRWLRRPLMAVRSRYTLYQGHMIHLEKYAPMGAATCFPVECLVFAICAMVAILRFHHRSLDIDHSSLSAIMRGTRLKVYGDDIVIEAKYVPCLYEVLYQLGFTVNKRKSYSDRKVLTFRESCGFEFLNGQDVSPLRTARKRGYWQSSLLSAEQTLAMIEHRNAAALSGHTLLQRVWDRRLRFSRVRIEYDALDSRTKRLYRKQGIPVSYWEELWGLLPFYNASEYTGQIGLVTFFQPDDHHLCYRYGRSSLDTALQRPYVWALSTKTEIDDLCRRVERSVIRNLGKDVSSNEAEWLDYWIRQKLYLVQRPLEGTGALSEVIRNETSSGLYRRYAKLVIRMTYK